MKREKRLTKKERKAAEPAQMQTFANGQQGNRDELEGETFAQCTLPACGCGSKARG